MTQPNAFEVKEVREAHYYLLVLGILTFFSGFMRLTGFFMGRLTGLKLVLHAVYALLVSCYCFYTSQQLRQFTRRGYYLALGLAVFMAAVAAIGAMLFFRPEPLSAAMMAFLAGLSGYIAWGLRKGPVKSLFIPQKPA